MCQKCATTRTPELAGACSVFGLETKETEHLPQPRDTWPAPAALWPCCMSVFLGVWACGKVRVRQNPGARVCAIMIPDPGSMDPMDQVWIFLTNRAAHRRSEVIPLWRTQSSGRFLLSPGLSMSPRSMRPPPSPFSRLPCQERHGH
jgi:hypothetical protein